MFGNRRESEGEGMRASGVQYMEEAQESHFWQRHSTRRGSSAGG